MVRWGYCEIELCKLESNLQYLLDNIGKVEDPSSPSGIDNSVRYLIALTKENKRRLSIRKERSNGLMELFFHLEAQRNSFLIST